MTIVPIGPVGVLRSGFQALAGTIKRAVGAGLIPPRDSTTLRQVLPPEQVGKRAAGSTITAQDAAGGSRAQVAKLVMLGHTVGQRVFSAQRGERLGIGSPLGPGEATSVVAARRKFPQLEGMAAAAQAIMDRHIGSTQARRRSWHEGGRLPSDGPVVSSGWKSAAHEPVVSLQTLKRAVENDLHASGLLAWSGEGKEPAAGIGPSPHLLGLAGGNQGLLAAVIAEVVEAGAAKGPGGEAAATALFNVLNVRHRISAG